MSINGTSSCRELRLVCSQVSYARLISSVHASQRKSTMLPPSLSSTEESAMQCNMGSTVIMASKSSISMKLKAWDLRTGILKAGCGMIWLHGTCPVLAVKRDTKRVEHLKKISDWLSWSNDPRVRYRGTQKPANGANSLFLKEKTIWRRCQ